MSQAFNNTAFAEAPLGEALLETLPVTRRLSEVVAMTAMDIALSSNLVVSSHQDLVTAALSLRNATYRKLMLDVLRDSRMSFMELYPERADREAIRDELAALDYFSSEDDVDELFPPDAANPQPYISAPQSHEDWYNCHPGGMSITCAVNARLSEYHTALYQHRYGVPADRDLAVAALCIHEYPKAWLYQWQDDASYLVEPRSFGGNMHTHDVYVVAEMLHRGAPAELVVAVAAAHSFGNVDVVQDGKESRFEWPGYDWVAKFLHAGAVLAQRDPEEAGLLERDKQGRLFLPPQPIEIWNCNLSDMNWPYTSGGAHKHVWPLLVGMCDEYGIDGPDTREFRQFKNYVFAQVGQIALYETFVRDGAESARDVVRALVTRG
jgi:hypothetical protein